MEEFLSTAIPCIIGGFIIGYRYKIGKYEEIIDSHMEFMEQHSKELEQLGIYIINNYKRKGKR